MNVVKSISKWLWWSPVEEEFRGNPVEEEFTLNNGLQLLVKSGDVMTETAGGVVVGEDEDFSGRGAIAQVLLQAGGKGYRKNRDQLKHLIKTSGITSPIYCCPAGANLRYDYVLHAIITYRRKRPKQTAGHLKGFFFDMVRVAEEKGLKDLVTPLLGTGKAKMPLNVIIEEVLDGLCLLQLKYLRRVILLEHDCKKAETIRDHVKRILLSGNSTDPQHLRDVGNWFHWHAGHTEGRAVSEKGRADSRTSYDNINLPGETAGDADDDVENSFLGQRTRTVQQQTRADHPEEGRKEFSAQCIKEHIMEESLVPANRGHRKSKARRDRQLEVLDSLQEQRPPLTPGGDPDPDADFRFRGQRKSKAQVPREDAAVSHQRSPSSPDPGLHRGLPLDTPADSAAADADDDVENSFQGQRTRTVQQQTRADHPEEGRKDFSAQHIKEDIMEEESLAPANRGQRKSKARRDRQPDVPDSLQEQRPTSTPGGDTDPGEDFRFRGQRKSKGQVPSEDAAVSHQRSPSSPDPGLDTPADFAVGDAGISEGTNFLGQRKRMIQQFTGRDESEDGNKDYPPTQHTAILEEGEKESPVSANRRQRKSKARRDRGLEIPNSLSEERPPSLLGVDSDHNEDFRFRGQRKSKAQVPREDAAVSHQRSPSSPETALPLDTSSTVRHTKDQEETRETALHTQPSEQDPGTEHGNRGERKGKRGNAGLAAGNSGRDSDTAKPSDKEMLRSIVGIMPDGTMSHTAKPGTHIPGYEGCGVIDVNYDIPDGIQKSEHPQPGSPYCGCVEHAFLPDNDEGRRVLRLLEEAFDRRLTFQVCEQPGGQALVEWADIPHKTCLRGTRDRGGYPDPDYLATVQNLLREKYGIE